MARYGDRLPYSTLSGPPPTVEIDPSDWRDLEEALGRVINLGARSTFTDILNSYLEDEAFERAAVRSNDVAGAARSTIDALAPFSSFAFGEMPEFAKSSNPLAWKELEQQLEERLSRRSILGRSTNDGPLDARVVPTPDLIMSVAIELVAALESIAKSPVPRGFEAHPGFSIGRAFDQLLINSKIWAKGAGLPFGPLSTDGGPSRFASFMFSVWQKLPAENRPKVSTAAAMAERIKAAGRGR